MPNTRKKPRISYKEVEEDEIFEDEEDEAFPVHQKKKSRTASSSSVASFFMNSSSSSSSKTTQPKLPQPPAPKPPLDILPKEMLQKVILYLDSAKDIYSLSMVGSKFLRSCLTPEVVVRAAYFTGGHVRTRICDVVRQVETLQSEIPSTFRLLRLVNATRCERGNLCYGYHLNRKKSAPVAMSERLEQGVLLCRTCTEILTTPCSGALAISSDDDGNDVFTLFDKRYSTQHHEFHALFTYPLSESVTEDDIGGILTAREFHQIQATVGCRPVLDLPECLVPVDYQKRRQELMDCLCKAQTDLAQRQEREKAAIEARRWNEYQKRQAKAQQQLDRKRRLQQSVLNKLRKALEDCPFQEAILLQQQQEGGSTASSTSTLTFAGPSAIKLDALLKSPSNGFARHIQTTARDLSTMYALLHRYGFLKGFPSFLVASGDAQPQGGTCGAIIYTYCKQQIQEKEREFFVPGNLPASRRDIPVFDNIITYLSLGMPLEFLLTMMSASQVQAAFERYLEKQLGGGGGSSSTSSRSRLAAAKNIALGLWRLKYDHRFALCGNNGVLRLAVVQNFWKDLLKARRNYHDYLQLPGVFPQNESVLARFYRTDYIKALLDRNFGDLLDRFTHELQRSMHHD